MDPPRSTQDASTQHAPSEPPRGGHEDYPATGTAAVVHTAFTKPVPLVPISMPSPATSREALSPSSPQTPPIPPATQSGPAQPIPVTYPQPSNAVAGPSRLPYPSNSIQGSDEEDRTGSSGVEGRHPSIYSRSGNGNGGGHGYYYGPGPGPGPQSASIRSPDRAASYHGTVRHSDRYPIPPPKTVPTTPTGIDPHAGGGYGGELNPDATMSRRSQIDWIVPTAMGQNPVNRRGDILSQVSTTITRERTVGERIEPTLNSAKQEKVKAERQAKIHGWALNVAIGAQVLLGALTTGVAAATTGRQTSIATTVLGGLSTMAASYLAKARGSGEPEESTRKAQDLNSFVRDCEAFMLDHGHKTGPDHDDMIMRYRRRFEEIMGNEFEGVGDDVKVNKKKESEKGGDSPA